MRDFLYKNSFIRYYVSLFNRNLMYKRRGAYMLVIMFTFGAMFSALWSAGDAIFGLYVFFICAGIGMYRRSQPNLCGLMPLSSRRKIVYQYLSPIFTMILVAIVVYVIIFLGYLLMCMYMICARIHVEFSFFSDTWYATVDKFEYMGVYGTSFAAIFTLFCYSCGMAYGFIPKNIYRVLYVIAFLFIMYMGFYGISYPSINRYEYSFGFSSPFAERTYNNMQYPWLCILLSAIIAVGTFVASVVFINKRIGKKGY